jgi:transcriptional regulator with XRE-family HTH domain
MQAAHRRYAAGSSRGRHSTTTLLAQLQAHIEAVASGRTDLDDNERGQRIKARREELRLTQPAVVEMIEAEAWRLPTDHPLRPDRAEKPPITLRGLQAWERGGGIVWEKAKLLATVLRIDVDDLLNGPKRETPDPFDPGTHPAAEERLLQILAKIDARLDDQDKVLKEIMAEQSRLRGLITQQDEAARTLAADGHAWADAALARYREAQLAEPQSQASAPKEHARSASRQG